MELLFVTLEPIRSASSATTINTALISELTRIGYHVTLLTLKNSAYSARNAEVEENARVDTVCLGTNAVYEHISGSRDTGARAFFRRIAKKAYRALCVYNYTYPTAVKAHISALKRRDYDIVLSASDPKTSHLLVRRLLHSGLHAKRWIQYWGDPLSGDITNTAIWPDFVLRNIEMRLIRQADKIIYVSPFTYKDACRKYKSKSSSMAFIPIPAVNSDTFTLPEQGELSLIYCGSYDSSMRNILPLYGAAEELGGKYRLTIAGRSDLTLQSSAAVTVLPQVSHEEAVRLETQGDIYVCILNRVGRQIPGKLYYYAASNKPILVIAEEGMDEIIDYVRSFHRFIVCANRIDDIVKALNAFCLDRQAAPNMSLSLQTVTKQILS